MGVFRIIFAFTTMFSLTYCYEQSSYSVDIPALMNSLTNLVTAAMSSTRTKEDPDSDVERPGSENAASEYSASENSAAGKLQGVALGVYSYMTAILRTLSRRVNEIRPNVEMGPGAFKPEIVTYPPDYFINRLKTLLKIKKKQEGMKKPLN